MASKNNHLEVVRMLLEHNAEIHVQNNAGEVALHLAACHYLHVHLPHFQIDILRLLLDRGADVNATDNEGSTPLHHSSSRRPGRDVSFSMKGSVEGTRVLLDHGGNIDAENEEGETPFQVAIEEEHHEMVEFLWGLGTMYL
jgi:ankyrin repeat protein